MKYKDKYEKGKYDKDKYIVCPPPMEPYTKLAHAYIPFQVMENVFCPEEALKKGTLFPELYMPYKQEKRYKHK